jgi:hypothetical protein
MVANNKKLIEDRRTTSRRLANTRLANANDFIDHAPELFSQGRRAADCRSSSPVFYYGGFQACVFHPASQQSKAAVGLPFLELTTCTHEAYLCVVNLCCASDDIGHTKTNLSESIFVILSTRPFQQLDFYFKHRCLYRKNKLLFARLPTRKQRAAQARFPFLTHTCSRMGGIRASATQRTPCPGPCWRNKRARLKATECAPHRRGRVWSGS